MSEPVLSENTDRELWREGDFYSPSIHVTSSGGIGINVGGTVIVRTLREWHSLGLLKSDPHQWMCLRLLTVRSDAANVP